MRGFIIIVYGTSFSDIDMEFSRKNGMGLEVNDYSVPVFLDNFNINHPKISRYMEGMAGVSMHGSYRDTFYTSDDPLICKVAKKRFYQSIQAAAFHCIDRVVFHSAYRNFYDGHSKYALELFLKKSIEFWQNFEENIPDGMTVYLENVEDNNPEVLAQIIEGVSSPKIRCCLDVGHAYCNSDIPLDRWVDVLGGSIAHVHLSDNDGCSDLHLPLGKGNIPLESVIGKILEKTGSSTIFVLECDAPESVQWLRKYGLLP